MKTEITRRSFLKQSSLVIAANRIFESLETVQRFSGKGRFGTPFQTPCFSGDCGG